MGGGVAFFDYDNDGDPDLLFVNSATWPWRAQPATPATSKLYRNRGDGTFEDVSAATGMDVVLYGMGVATGDYARHRPSLHSTSRRDKSRKRLCFATCARVSSSAARGTPRITVLPPTRRRPT